MSDNLATLLDDFRRHGRETAVVRYKGVRRRVTTYAEIARMAGRFAALLEQRGIRADERVLIWAENGAEWIAAFHGCLLRGVIAVPLDAYGSADFAARVCADVRPSLAVGDAILLRQLPSNPGCRIPHVAFEGWDEELPAEEAGPVAGLSRETPLQILFTSGTTGEPKGIVHTHGNVLASSDPIREASQRYMKYERLVHPLRILNTLPLSHVFGQMMGLWVPPIYAAEVHFESRLVASRLVETIRRERISVLAAVPRVLALMKTHLEATTPGLEERAAVRGSPSPLAMWWRFRDVHWKFGWKFWALISGGGALPGPLEQFWNTMGFVLVQGYGMTETTAVITLNHPFHVAEGSIGRPLAGREVKLGPDGEVLVRGASISRATWSGGELRKREDEWLSTGDLAEREPGGELKFLGRKSEVIVTASGVNVHPEDLEAAVEREPGVAACAVVAMETPQGMEPCAVLAIRGAAAQAGAAIERANTRLAEFQRIRRWEIWPEPDLPRTSTGKVRRKTVAEWLAARHEAGKRAGEGAGGAANANGTGIRGDWLLGLVAQVTGESQASGDDDLLLSEDLHLDSLGRVQLNAAIEERLGTAPEDGALAEVRTLGQLRRLLGGESNGNAEIVAPHALAAPDTRSMEGPSAGDSRVTPEKPVASGAGNHTALATAGTNSEKTAPAPMEAPRSRYIYPRWPWRWPVRWARNLFVELLMRPLVWLLAKPTVSGGDKLAAEAPMLIIANHITAYDGALIEYALPGMIRRRMAIAMSGEMLEDFRHFRNPDRPDGGFYPLGLLYYLLVTASFNVFPLHKQRDFQRGFEHAGAALDRGMNVLVFPEGIRSPEGKLARFRPGIGLLAKQADAPVLPLAICGLGELKTRQRGWFRSGMIELRIGEPIRFGPEETETAITAKLQAAVEGLMGDEG
jgi:long-chain acyl-CoA synthetase